MISRSNVIILVIIALFGLTIGSFLNVLILRKSVKKSLLGRSRCPQCRKELSPVELIPIVSFLIQKGQCRNCGIALSWQYPLVEALTALLFVAAYIIVPAGGVYTSIPFGFALLIAWISIAAGIIIFISDLRYTIIPDYASLILFLSGTITSIVRNNASFTVSLQNPLVIDWLSAIILSGFYAFLWFISGGRWMGLGDAKLTLGTSLLLGFPVSLLAFLFSFWLGALAGILLLLLARKNLKSELPFGPFIIIASVLAYFLAPYVTCINYPIMCLIT